MAKSFTYVTHKELKRIFPQVDSYDRKIPIYNWVKGIHDFHDSSMDAYYAVNTGLITNLYKDGVELREITYPASATTEVETEMSESSANLLVDSGSSFGADDIVKVGSEYMEVNTVSTNTLQLNDATARRGLFGTSTDIHAVDSSVYLVVDASADLPSISAASDAPVWFYDEYLDLCVIMGDSLETTYNPNESLMEAGEDNTAMNLQYRIDASRLLDAMLDANLPRQQLMQPDGTFDYIIIRTAGLIAASLMIKANDPTSELVGVYMGEAEENIEALNSGKASLSWQTKADDSSGVIRDVTYTSLGLRPIDTRGAYSGTFDLIKVKIIDAGVIGTGTYSVWVKNSTLLGKGEGKQVVTAKTINGDFQTLAGGLQIRFGGEAKTATANANDEWEIEVTGIGERIDNFRSGGIQLTRKGYID